MAILELLREPVHTAQDDALRRFAGKPLPLVAIEQAAFDSCRMLWHALFAGYMRCVEAALAGDASLRAGAPLALLRALSALAEEQMATHRAGRQPDPEHWKLLHQLYATAEQGGFALQEMMDPLRHGKTPCTATSVYVETILLGAASLHELPQRQIGWVERWVRRWAAKVRLLDAPPTLSTRAIPLCVDLASDRPAAYLPLSGPGARWLETADLRNSLKKRLVLLEQGEPPAKLHLGNDCTQPACEQLLTAMYQRWCKGGAARRIERRPASGTCRFIAGVEAIHYYLAGRKPFKQPGIASMDMLRKEREELATFGRVASHRDEHFSEQHGFGVEEWQVREDWHLVDESATGLCIARPAAQPGARIGHGQLIAIGAAQADDFLLGCVRWSMIAGANDLQAGIRIYPGRADAIALRLAAGEKFRQGFLLPATPALKEGPSVILPVGAYKRDRELEIHTGKEQKIRLTGLLDRGADFERSGYEFV
jgi:hypothetical protein